MQNTDISADIKAIKNLLSEYNLQIPSYQRPYTWSEKSALTLLNDILDAYNQKLQEYRIGTVILHQTNSNDNPIYNIVDGQQRLTTLILLLLCLTDNKNDSLKDIINDNSSKNNENIIRDNLNKPLSEPNIIKNYIILRRNLLKTNNKQEIKNYILTNCKVVIICTSSEQEAFQFFDSQNNRGKALEVHDILKSYHLREMKNDDEMTKMHLVETWENTNTATLVNLFTNYLFPLTQWYKGNIGIDYSIKNIDTFKGIKLNNQYNYAIYHKASNLYVENIIKTNMIEILPNLIINQFQLTQPVISGKRFFKYVNHYLSLLKKIEDLVKLKYDSNLIPQDLSGDRYTYQLFICTLLFFADKFSYDCLTDTIIDILYIYSYSIRLTMHSVYLQTINKYALGNHDKINKGINIFKFINEMEKPKDLELLHLDKLNSEILDQNKGINKEKYKEIIEKFNKFWGYNNEQKI